MNTATVDPADAVVDAVVTYTAENPNHSRLALKNGGHFLILDEVGMMPGIRAAGYGLYHDDTRYLSRFQIKVNGVAPQLLNANLERGYAGSFTYSNPAFDGVPSQTMLLQRELTIVDKSLCERIKVTNFGGNPLAVHVDLLFAADFVDMFEVRSTKRDRRGDSLPTFVSPAKRDVVFSYRGVDNVVMQTRLDFSGRLPDALSESKASFVLTLEPGQENAVTFDVAVTTSREEDLRLRVNPPIDAADNLVRADAQYQSWRDQGATITTGNKVFNKLLEQSYRDLYILRQETPRGACIAAGIPWYAVAFGRDEAVVGLQTLPFLPQLARDVISVLAAYQGKIHDERTVQRLGKIMHELRLGEMARNNEIPFNPSYGTVDATMLWLMLLCRYVQWTGDYAFARKHWKSVHLALRYFDVEVARNGYCTYGPAGSNECWKDSPNSIMYSDGKLAKGPIAACEVQGYLYAAWTGLSQLAEALGYTRQARALDSKAYQLKKRFQRDFWMPEKSFVALALDGDGRQCDVVSSNPGHLLATGILSDEQANAVAERLLSADMSSGWGIRTLSAQEAAYNPLSYHNGSVWPHDNAMVLEGICHLGLAERAEPVLQGLFDAAQCKPDLRLPELYCGLDRGNSPAPVNYPVSCSPQAWVAGSPFQLMASFLGITPDASTNTLRVKAAHVPAWLGKVRVTGMRVGNSTVDLEFANRRGVTKCRVLRKSRGMKVEIGS